MLQRRSVRLIHESRFLVLSKLKEWRDKNLIGENDAKETLKVFAELTDLLETNVDGLSRVDGAGAAHRTALQQLADALNAEMTKLQVGSVIGPPTLFETAFYALCARLQKLLFLGGVSEFNNKLFFCS